MSIHPPSSLEIPKTRDNASKVAIEQRTISTTSSRTANRFSPGSTEAGPSSSRASDRDSSSTAVAEDGLSYDGAGRIGPQETDRQDELPRDGRSSHRSHRSKGSGGFLLSNVFEQSTDLPPTTITPHHRTHHSPRYDSKGKAALPIPGKKHMKRRSDIGISIGSSPLSTNVESAATGSGSRSPAPPGDAVADNVRYASSASTPATLDVDAAQIVSLALNLSESRRNAAMRSTSNQAAAGTAEGSVGGSLRQHLQQQRRISRTVSPKPDRGGRASSGQIRVASGQRLSSPLQPAFDKSDQNYRYHISASTLARAEKAKAAIELMAQYQRLLQYVPPLKPQGLNRISTTGSVNSSLVTSKEPLSGARSSSYNGSSAPPLGREYNPLQYIRNRKLRARERRAIDGEAQGFDNVDKVTSWVDEISERVSLMEYRGGDFLLMPSFSDAADAAASPLASPQSSQGRAQPTANKVKRPRIDWEINPADMIAEVFWLEQEDNKKLIEDKHGRKIFPPTLELHRSLSRRGAEVDFSEYTAMSARKESPDPDLRINTQLPEFKSIRGNHEGHLGIAKEKAKQKLRDVRDAAHIHHGRSDSIRRNHHLRKSQSRSDSDFSDSDAVREPRRSRSGTAESPDQGDSVLEKQMADLIRQQSKDTRLDGQRSLDGQQMRLSLDSAKIAVNDASSRSGSKANSRAGSIVNKGGNSRRNSARQASSGRGSLEVPGASPRGSLEGLDITVPNSPETAAARPPNGIYPSIAMDLSPPVSRTMSPISNTLSKVKARMSPFHDNNHDHRRNSSQGGSGDDSRSLAQLLDPKVGRMEVQQAIEKRARSLSPAKRVSSHQSDKGHKSTKSGSYRRTKGSLEPSGIKGLFKGTRGPVARVSDFVWKKDASRHRGSSSGLSTDESDVEEPRRSQPGTRNASPHDSLARTDEYDIDEVLPGQVKPSHLNEMPVFTSPFDRRGRPLRARSDETVSAPSNFDAQYRAREERRKASRAYLQDPTPKIDIQSASPASSPDIGPTDRFRRQSSISDVDFRRPSFASGGVQRADSRLNAILGLPGRDRLETLPVTGLASLETCHENNGSLTHEGGGRWSISECGVAPPRGPMTKREIARVRALLLSSGIKAKEISRRAAEPRDLRLSDEKLFAQIANLSPAPLKPVPRSQEHILAARVLSDDIQLSVRMWQISADTFCNTTVEELLSRVSGLQTQLADTLTPMTRKAADEADEVSRDLATGQTLKVKRLMDQMEAMMRRRRRRFRWLRRGGWVLVEWALVGVMWYVWFLVVVVRIVVGLLSGCVGAVRWLFWL